MKMSGIFKSALKIVLVASVILGGWSGAKAMAEDVIESEGARIIGDSDLPKALYIVPWKKPPLPTLSSRPIKPFVDDALSSATREGLLEEIKYHELFHPDKPAKPHK